MELEGKVAIVTGSARGIGRAIAKDLGRAGARVVINYRTSAEEAESLAQEIPQAMDGHRNKRRALELVMTAAMEGRSSAYSAALR